MGVAGLWAELEPCQNITSFTALALTKLNSPSRGFRIGIDASIWFFHAEHGKEGENPELRTLFFRCAQLTNHALLPLFVFDGPKRPEFKRGKKINKSGNKLISGMKGILDSFGFEYRTAPGEAEAELAFLNRIGVIDGILSDDVDNFLFGACTVIRNHSSTHAIAAAASSIEKSKLVVYTLPHPSLPELEPADLIFIALCSGGDYDATGIPSCGIKIAFGLARAGFGKSLYKAATTMNKDSQQLRDFLGEWRAGIKRELTTNSTGFLPMRKPSVARKIPDTFPDINVLFFYVNPITSETVGRLDLYDDLMVGHGEANGWLKKDPSLPLLASTCELHFEWGIMDTIVKRFRTVIFPGVVHRILRRAILTKDSARSSQRSGAVTLDAQFIKQHFSSHDADLSEGPFSVLASKIRSTRTHVSTSKTLEYRLEIDPAVLVKLTASGVRGIRKADANEWAYLDEEEVEGSDSDLGKTAGGSQKEHNPYKVLRVWIAADLVREAVPALVQEYEEVQRKKEEKKAKKGKRGTTASPTKLKAKPRAHAEILEPVHSQPLFEGEKENDKEATVSSPSKPPVSKAKAPSISPKKRKVASALAPRNAKNKLLAALDGVFLSSEEENDDEVLLESVHSLPKPDKCSRPKRQDHRYSSETDGESSKLATSKTTMEPTGRGCLKSGTDSNVSTRAKKSTTTVTGINSYFNAQKPLASGIVDAKGKGKGKATAPAAAQRYIAMCNQAGDSTDDETTLPEADELFRHLSSKTTATKAAPIQSSPPRHMYFDDDLLSPSRPFAEPLDKSSLRKNPVTTNRRKNSILSNDGPEPSTDRDKLKKSPRKSSEHTSPRKSASSAATRPGGGIPRTISDITHPSRSRRAFSPTPANRNTVSCSRTAKPLPLIYISSSDEEKGNLETKVVPKQMKKDKTLTPLEAARARSRNKVSSQKAMEVIDLT